MIAAVLQSRAAGVEIVQLAASWTRGLVDLIMTEPYPEDRIQLLSLALEELAFTLRMVERPKDVVDDILDHIMEARMQEAISIYTRLRKGGVT